MNIRVKSTRDSKAYIRISEYGYDVMPSANMIVTINKEV